MFGEFTDWLRRAVGLAPRGHGSRDDDGTSRRVAEDPDFPL